MTGVPELAHYRRCVERIERSWQPFLARRRGHMAQAERFGSAPERTTERILETLFSDVLDWPVEHVNSQVEYADIVLTSPGFRWAIIETKRPGRLAWHRGAIDNALAQACRYADEQKVRTVAVSDGNMFYAADRANGGLQDRLFVDLAAQVPPNELWWISVHGIYQHRDDAAAPAGYAT